MLRRIGDIFNVRNKDMVVANFFWNGSALPLWNKACLLSFANNGFRVNVYSYSRELFETLHHDGIKICDANDICPEGFLKKLVSSASPQSYGETYACFTDYFRLLLISKTEGWWFDTDVFCLKNAKDFNKITQASGNKVVCGYQTPSEDTQPKVCNAIIHSFNKKIMKNYYDKLINEYPPHEPHAYKWAQTAIPYLNSLITESPSDFSIQSRQTFYPVSWHPDELITLLLPKHCNKVQKKCKDSLTLHYWNEIFSRKNISRDTLPPEGSFLNLLIKQNCPEIGSHDSLAITGIEDAFL